MYISEALKVLEELWQKGDYQKVRQGALEILQTHKRNQEALEWLKKAEHKLELPDHEHHHVKHHAHIRKHNRLYLIIVITLLVLGAVAAWWFIR